ncbi:aconitate hydratase, partial [Candidatus Aerophobetes bacterium]|nr:aconitate hydratase [Candidatus Aerophobetes bacterium]
MGKNIVEKILEAHIVSGKVKEGELIGVRVDQVYTQDATGTMAWLEFEAIGLDKVRVPLAVSYVDHNMLQSNFMNADDHLFLRTAAARFGAYFSRPGNGICHQVHLERFAAPGLIALGTDSHTPTGGGMGMIAIGVGGLEAASVMAGMPFEFTMPKVVKINLYGKLRRPYVTAMDVILTLLKMLTVKGGVGKIFEYGGEGVKDLSVTDRATITNMGAELGATTSIFPSDENTLKFLKAQGRDYQWIPLEADEDAEYAEIIELDLSEIEPMIAQPHSPDNVVAVRELKGMKVNQVCIGSCTNSSYNMMKTVASILKGKTVNEEVTLFINPGSKQVYQMLAREGDIETMIAAGARILESACGPCIGMGGAPGSGQVSIRSYNRNFKGRSGTKDAFVYLASPVVCALAAL